MSEEIDVSGCEYYVEGNQTYNCVSDCAVTYYDYCEQNPNCYYKQLKRLEAENAKLQKIKDICHEASAIDTELSLRILEVIEGAEDETEEEINKKIATLFTDFTTKFMDKICDQILENRNEGHWYWLRADQIKNITKDILKDIKGDEEC